VLGDRPNQLDRLREDDRLTAGDLLDIRVPGGEISEDGLRVDVSVGIRYIASWLDGVGAAAINNLMEDTATAEISRAQVWQWVQTGRWSKDDVRAVVREELSRLGPSYARAADLFERVALADEFVEFLTLPAYGLLQ
jgi:malate synthase